MNVSADHEDNRAATPSSLEVPMPTVAGTWEAHLRRGTRIDEALVRELEQLIVRMEQHHVGALDRYPWPSELTHGLSRRVKAGMRRIQQCHPHGSQLKIVPPDVKA